MRLMTFRALERLAMFLVAAITILLGVQVWSCSKDLLDISVTGLTCRVGILSFRQVVTQWMVCRVTLLTIGNRVVGYITRVMTLITARDDFLTERRMSTVTTDAWLFFMRSTFFSQQTGRVCVTGCADRSGLARTSLNHMRQMRRMALQAINLFHVWHMRFMTIETLLRGPMLTNMTLAAIERRMLVRVLLMQPFLIIVTGQADRLHFAQLAEIHFNRLMRIMTTGTVI